MKSPILANSELVHGINPDQQCSHLCVANPSLNIFQLGEFPKAVSSGLRVVTASDNAAYWSISTTMRSDNGALSAVQDTLGLGAAKVDVAYAGIDSVIAVLDKFKSKLVAATDEGVDKTKIQTELDQLKSRLSAPQNPRVSAVKIG